MSGEVDLPGIEGKIVKNGVAAHVTRQDGVTHVRLSFVPGHEPATGPGPQVIELPEAVTCEPGLLVVEWEDRRATFPND